MKKINKKRKTCQELTNETIEKKENILLFICNGKKRFQTSNPKFQYLFK